MGMIDERFHIVVTLELTSLCTCHAMPIENQISPSQLQKFNNVFDVMKGNEEQKTWFILFFKNILK
jgi:hypothetical protein